MGCKTTPKLKMEKEYLKYLIKQSIKEIEEEDIQKELYSLELKKVYEQTYFYNGVGEFTEYLFTLIKRALETRDRVILSDDGFKDIMNNFSEYLYFVDRYYLKRDAKDELKYIKEHQRLPLGFTIMGKLNSLITNDNELTSLPRGAGIYTIVYKKDNSENVLNNVGKSITLCDINQLKLRIEQAEEKINFWEERKHNLIERLEIIENAKDTNK